MKNVKLRKGTICESRSNTQQGAKITLCGLVEYKLVSFILVSAFALTGCGVSQGKHNAVAAERDHLAKQVTEMANEVVNLKAAKSAAEKSVSELQNQVTTITQERDKLKADYDTLQAKVNELQAAKSTMEGQLAAAQSGMNKPKSIAPPSASGVSVSAVSQH